MNERTLPLEQLPPTPDGVPAFIKETGQATMRFVELVNGGNWQELLQYSGALNGIAERIRVDAAARGRLAGLAAPYQKEQDKQLRGAFTTLAADPSPEADVARHNILVELEAQLGNAAAAETMLNSLLEGDAALFRSTKSENAAAQRQESALMRSFVHLSVLAGRALYEGDLNAAYALTTGQDSTLMDGDLAVMSLLADDLETLHDAVFGRLYGLLSAGAPIDDYEAAATVAQARSAAAVGRAAMLLGSALGLVGNTSDGKLRREQFQEALRVTELIKRLMVLLDYGAYARFEAATRDASRWYGHEKRRTRQRVFESRVPQGELRALNDLGADVETGAFVQVEGEISDLRVDDDPSPPKFSTFLTLTDPETGASVQVRAHMFSLINNGVRNGAYGRINGYLRRGESWMSDSIGLEIDRVSLTALRRDSWLDDVTYRTRQDVRLYPDEMNMFYTPGFGG